MRFVGERRAFAAVTFAFYFVYLALVLLSGALPPEMKPMMAALAGVYGLAFFGLVAGYFWARWYAVGVGLWGVILGALLLWQGGVHPLFLFIGGSHLVATLLLWGDSMSQSYDGQMQWRERFHMDENAVHRLGKSVIRAGVYLPFVLLYALQPKPPGAGFVVALIALASTGVGLRGLVRAKTWGVLAIGAAGAMMLAIAAGEAISGNESLVLDPALAGAGLLSAAAPWARSIARAL